MEQGRIDDVGMAHHPADVRGRPIDLAGIDAIKILHRPFERDHVAAIVAHHPFRDAGRTRSIENVERVSGGNRDAFAGLGVVDRILPDLTPVVVTSRRKGCLTLRTLENHAGLWLVFGDVDRFIQ